MPGVRQPTFLQWRIAIGRLSRGDRPVHGPRCSRALPRRRNSSQCWSCGHGNGKPDFLGSQPPERPTHNPGSKAHRNIDISGAIATNHYATDGQRRLLTELRPIVALGAASAQVSVARLADELRSWQIQMASARRSSLKPDVQGPAERANNVEDVRVGRLAFARSDGGEIIAPSLNVPSSGS